VITTEDIERIRQDIANGGWGGHDATVLELCTAVEEARASLSSDGSRLEHLEAKEERLSGIGQGASGQTVPPKDERAKRIASARALAAEGLSLSGSATPGPWIAKCAEVPGIYCDCCAGAVPEGNANALFIAWARKGVPDLTTDVLYLADQLGAAEDAARIAITLGSHWAIAGEMMGRFGRMEAFAAFRLWMAAKIATSKVNAIIDRAQQLTAGDAAAISEALRGLVAMVDGSAFRVFDGAQRWCPCGADPSQDPVEIPQNRIGPEGKFVTCIALQCRVCGCTIGAKGIANAEVAQQASNAPEKP
jgi:hypothetical protein